MVDDYSQPVIRHHCDCTGLLKGLALHPTRINGGAAELMHNVEALVPVRGHRRIPIS